MSTVLPIAEPKNWDSENLPSFPANLRTREFTRNAASWNHDALVDTIMEAQSAQVGVVTLPPGPIFIKLIDGLPILRNTKIRGHGTGVRQDDLHSGSTLIAYDSSPAMLTSNDFTVDNVDLRDFTLETNGNMIGVMIDMPCQHSRIENIAIQGERKAQIGLRIQRLEHPTWVNWVRACHIRQCEIGFHNYGSDSHFLNNYFNANLVNMIEEGGGGTEIAGNMFDVSISALSRFEGIGHGLILQKPSHAPGGTTVLGNYFHFNDRAILVRGIDGQAFEVGHIIADNRFIGNLDTDIRIEDACKWKVHDNTHFGNRAGAKFGMSFHNVAYGLIHDESYDHNYVKHFGDRIKEHIIARDCYIWPRGVTPAPPIPID